MEVKPEEIFELIEKDEDNKITFGKQALQGNFDITQLSCLAARDGKCCDCWSITFSVAQYHVVFCTYFYPIAMFVQFLLFIKTRGKNEMYTFIGDKITIFGAELLMVRAANKYFPTRLAVQPYNSYYMIHKYNFI